MKPRRLWWLAATVLASGCVSTSTPIAPVREGESLFGVSASFAPSSLLAVGYRRGLSPTVDAGVQVGLFGYGADVRQHFYIDDTRAYTWYTGALAGILVSRIETRVQYARFGSGPQVRFGPYLSYSEFGGNFFSGGDVSQRDLSVGLNLGGGDHIELPLIGRLPLIPITDFWLGYAVPVSHGPNAVFAAAGLEIGMQFSLFFDFNERSTRPPVSLP